MVPGPVNTPGMRTTAFLSTVGEGDCCAATGAPPITDVMTHTPVTASTLLIKYIICTHPHPKGSRNDISSQAIHRLRLKGDTWKQTNVDVDQVPPLLVLSLRAGGRNDELHDASIGFARIGRDGESELSAHRQHRGVFGQHLALDHLEVLGAGIFDDHLHEQVAETAPFEIGAHEDGVFAALSKGGLVTMPLTKTFWSPRFGMLTDRFGLSWMVSVAGS